MSRHIIHVEPSPPFGLFFGRPMPFSEVSLIITNTGAKLLPDLFYIQTCIAASERICRLATHLGETHVDLIPLHIMDRHGAEYQNYKILHFRDNLPCMDKANSKFTINQDGIIKNISCLRLLEELIPAERHIFRLKERPDIIIASEPFTRSFTTEGYTGAEFADI